MQTVLFTSVFERHLRRAGLSDAELMHVVSLLAENPLAGVLIPGTGGARKLRIPRAGQGKSGGYRTVHYYGGEDVPVFLLALIDKGERANLSKAERNELAIILPKIAQRYRDAAKADVKPET
jgi:hypothetical protein